MAGSNCFGIWWRGWWSWNCATVKEPTGWYVYVPRSRWAIHLWRATLARLFRRTCQGKCSGKPTALPDRFDGSRHWGHWLLLDSVKLCSSSDLPSRIGYDSLEPWGHLALSERILNVLNLRNNSGSFWPSSKRCILEEGSRLCSLVCWTPPFIYFNRSSSTFSNSTYISTSSNNCAIHFSSFIYIQFYQYFYSGSVANSFSSATVQRNWVKPPR